MVGGLGNARLVPGRVRIESQLQEAAGHGVSCPSERFPTHFQPARLHPPENQPLAAFLARRWGAPIDKPPITRQIADGAKGNVRAAMADLEMWMG